LQTNRRKVRKNKKERKKKDENSRVSSEGTGVWNFLVHRNSDDGIFIRATWKRMSDRIESFRGFGLVANVW